ncbi:unnamed protein product [Triticum turgidum subsp. durum]|uniref:Rx N-terminal domain-containing protein n=1 Tax=Triticum turgidum subsp. durum TaxID=4567 RepID=A0A9R1QXD6_TRITD|nr:unnamed protein product [Triticum turgidum subsp. durum]
MSELAAGAVSSLLVVIRSEALLLRGVRDDVQFIKEEMESMKSFLTHLTRWAPPGGEHDDQVRTWMNQVRLLAQDCNNSIGLYLYRGNPDIRRARGGLRGYLWWATWFFHKLAAQHRAAEELRLLKERARDVGERRLRYGVEVPTMSGKGQSPSRASSSSSWAAAAGGYAAAGDDEEEEEGETSKHMEKEVRGGEIESQQTAWIQLDEVQYAHILRKLLPKSVSKPLQAQDRSLDRQATKTTKATLGEDQIKQMIHDAKEDILRELQQGKHDKSEGTGEREAMGQNPESVSERIFAGLVDQMMEKMKDEFKEQFKIKGLVNEIKNNLNPHPFRDNKCECPLFILKVDELMDVSTCEDIRNALSLLNCSADLMIVTTTKDIQLAKEYCYPQRQPIDYSLAGLYHDTVLEYTSQQKNEDSYNPQIFHDILYECEPHEFCMKIFTHALYANPKRSGDELHKLHSTLHALPTTSFYSIAKVMFKFSYNDLPKEYKSCLLYLAIFSPRQKIRRSTLIARWVAEGLTSKEDWPSSVRQANRCFDTLVGRCLIDPADIDAMGKVKSCVVSDSVHGFITTIARKQHIVETRLSHHLARHFSIFNDLQLRSSDKIDHSSMGSLNHLKYPCSRC